MTHASAASTNSPFSGQSAEEATTRGPEEHLHGLLSTICDLLKSKEQRTATKPKQRWCVCWRNLVEYVDNIVTELRRSLKEGFMLHVLGNVMGNAY